MPQMFKQVNSTGTYWYADTECTILHREDGPAMEYADGSKAWWVNGNMHRVGAPALVRIDGYQEWLINGELHREDGPAIITQYGDMLWFKHGELHRLDGPAVERVYGGKKQMPSVSGHETKPLAFKFWYIDGVQMTEEEHKQNAIPPVKVLASGSTQYPTNSNRGTELHKLHTAVTGNKTSDSI